MKKISFSIAIVAIFLLLSCSEELSLINQSLIRDQLSQIPVPTAEEIQQKLSSSSPQKIGAAEILSKRVLQLDKEYFDITEYYATRYLQYYEIASWGELKRSVQIEQRFQIKDGVLDTTTWSAHADLEGIGIRRCTLWFSDYITTTTVFFSGNDGLQLAYRANLYEGALYLPALADGTWQVQVEMFNKGIWQTFITRKTEIRMSDPSEFFLVYDDIMAFTDPRNNTIAIVTVSAESLQGNYLFVCEDENENCYSQPIPSTIVSETISFAIPFNPRYIYIWGQNQKQTEIGPGVQIGSDGLYHYNLW